LILDSKTAPSSSWNPESGIAQQVVLSTERLPAQVLEWLTSNDISVDGGEFVV